MVDLVTEHLLFRPSSREWTFCEDPQGALFNSAYGCLVLDRLLSVVHDPAVWRRTRRLRPGEPAPALVHLLGWQGDLNLEPMIFLFLHTRTWHWFEQRFLVVSVRHRTLAQRAGRMTEGGLRGLLRDFRTVHNEPLFGPDVELPSLWGVGLLVNEKKGGHPPKAKRDADHRPPGLVQPPGADGPPTPADALVPVG